MPKVNNRPIGENSPNLVTLTVILHPRPLEMLCAKRKRKNMSGSINEWYGKGQFHGSHWRIT
jgi:hypothetical protein